jgi:hypothetical protein
MILGNVLDLGVPSDNTVTTAKLADSSVTAAKITDATITAAKLASGTVQNQSAFKNIIINGDMSIAQRSTSVSGITTGGYLTIDRFTTGVGTVGTWTQSQSTDVPTGQGFAKSLKMECTTANASLSASSNLAIQQKNEGQNVQYLKKGTANAESTTLSFWVKSNKTGTYIAELYDEDNSRSISKSYTINSADTWEKKTITYAGDTTGTFNNDNGESLDVNFWLGAGTNWSSGTLQTTWGSYDATKRATGQVNLADSTSNYINITGIQLEAGTTASDFEFLPYDVNLTRCQRYFYQAGTNLNGAGEVTFGTGQWYSASEVLYCIYAPTRMRVKPTSSTPTVTSGYRFHKAGSYTDVDSAGVMTDADNQILSIYKSGLGGGTGGQATFVVSQSSPAKIQFNAEL